MHVTPPTPTGPTAEACARLGDVIPQRLEHLASRVVTPVSPDDHAWGDPAVVLRCGVPSPSGYTATSELATVDGIDWFQSVGASAVTWTALTSPSYVELVVPKEYADQGAFLADLAPALTRAFGATSTRSSG